jgi:hypothetical protein
MLGYGRRIAAEIERLLGHSEHPIARALVASRGARGSGPDGAWTRRDHRRVVQLGIVAIIVGWAIALGILDIADQHPSGSRWNTILSGVGLFFAFGGMFIGWQAHKHIRSAFARNADASR